MRASPAPTISPDLAEDGLPVPQRYWSMLTLMAGLAMSVLDTAIVNVALPVIAKDMHADAADAIWVVNAYQLAVLVSLLPFASFGDIFGYRRVYRFGLVTLHGGDIDQRDCRLAGDADPRRAVCRGSAPPG